MFKVFCPSHAREVLLTIRHIRRLRTTADGLWVEWRCWCGHEGCSLNGDPVPDVIPEAS